mgnify:CR=1 FL=1
MLGGLKNKIVGGEPIISHSISLRTVESEIAKNITKIQNIVASLSPCKNYCTYMLEENLNKTLVGKYVSMHAFYHRNYL